MMHLLVFPSGLFQTNAYFLGCENTHKAIFIDPAPESAPKLLNALREHQYELEAIFLTHSHWDHIADIGKILAEIPCPLFVHQADSPNLEEPGVDGLPLLMDITPQKPTAFLKDRQHFHVGDLKGVVIHTPGHSPGGVCFYFPEEKVLISGDTLFQNSIGNISFPTSDPEAMWESCQQLAKLPGETKVYPGHGAPTTIAEESWLPRAATLFGGSYE